VDRFLAWERVGDVQISPDGGRILYTRSRVDARDDAWDSEIWIMDADGGRQRFLIEGSAPRWSPDGSRIAFMAPDEDDRPQIHVRWMDAEGAVSQVTRTEETPSGFRWSPDGESLAFTMFVPDEDRWSVDLPPRPEGAEWTAPPRVVDRVHYRMDRTGFLDDGTYHLFVVPAVGGSARQLTTGEGVVGDLFVGLRFGASFDWTPDGREIVFSGLLGEDWDRAYQDLRIYAVNVQNRAVRRVTSEPGIWTGPVVSPDGRWIAFSGTPRTDDTYRAASLYLIASDGSGRRLLSGDLDRDLEPLVWAADGGSLYAAVQDRGAMDVWHFPLEGSPRRLTEGTHMLSLSSMTDDGVAVGTRSSPHEPGDVVRYRLPDYDGLAELTHVNDDVLADVELGDVEEIWYASTGGEQVQGWVVKPPDFDPDRTYPLILSIHGGPHGMYDVGFDFSFQNFAANDYLVLYTNPRGSTGYGSAFGNAIDNDYPGVDYDDLMAGVDAVIERGWVDEDNMFVTGCSGGGILTAWVIGHTDRFAGAGVRCPVINWFSMAGTTDVVRWTYEWFEGYPWTNPDAFLEHSPIMYVDRVTTPTVIMTGELDLRTPMTQSEEYYQALKAVGVPVVLLRFQEEYHGTGSKPSNFMRTQLYLMSWWEKWGDFDGSAPDVAATGR
jgi:dipeptidyl aminopeptidase/acylaminoacyl peptidase